MHVDGQIKTCILSMVIRSKTMPLRAKLYRALPRFWMCKLNLHRWHAQLNRQLGQEVHCTLALFCAGRHKRATAQQSFYQKKIAQNVLTLLF